MWCYHQILTFICIHNSLSLIHIPLSFLLFLLHKYFFLHFHPQSLHFFIFFLNSFFFLCITLIQLLNQSTNPANNDTQTYCKAYTHIYFFNTSKKGLKIDKRVLIFNLCIIISWHLNDTFYFYHKSWHRVDT